MSTAATDPRETLTEVSGVAELTMHGGSISINEKRARAGDISHAVPGSGNPERTDDGNPAKTRRLGMTTRPFHPFVPKQAHNRVGKEMNNPYLQGTNDSWQGSPAIRNASVGQNGVPLQNNHGDSRHAVPGSGNPELSEDGKPAKARGLGMTTRPFHPVVPNPYDRRGKEMKNPYLQGVSWQGSPAIDNAGRNCMPLQSNPGPAIQRLAQWKAGTTVHCQAQSHRNLPNNERNNGGTSIDARSNDSAGRAAANGRFGDKFDEKVLRHTKYGCMVCTIVGNSTEMKSHGHCIEALQLERSTCKSCLSNRHLANVCPAKIHKRMLQTCVFCLRSREYHKVAFFCNCPPAWNDLLWNTVSLMMKYRNVQFRSIPQAGMGFKQGIMYRVRRKV
jgi:hypothetical protein